MVGVGSAEQRASSRQSSGDMPRGHWLGKAEITKGAATQPAPATCDAPALLRPALGFFLVFFKNCCP
jgi:hypothetical protein